MDNKQEKFQFYNIVEKPSHEKKSWKVKDEEVKDPLKCQHRKWVGRIIGNLKDEKGVLQA